MSASNNARWAETILPKVGAIPVVTVVHSGFKFSFMATFLSLIAITLLSVVPYVRPCSCGDFDLFCACVVERPAHGPPADHCCTSDESSGCQAPHRGGDRPSTPEPMPKDKPCKLPLAPELGAGVIAHDAPGLVSIPVLDAVGTMAVVQVACDLTIARRPAPRAPPDPVGLIVVRTQFLLL